uniref:KASH domain-containing protein n=1 Tax=Heterorhabditis bacteriophora TaxID=37862 RepID=A0A1I7XIJ7_HETBA
MTGITAMCARNMAAYLIVDNLGSPNEFLGPPSKRIRYSSSSVKISGDEDTLPFAESEYESIMDGRATVTSVSSEEFTTRNKKWDSLQQDIGYSSGENSIHEALNNVVNNRYEYVLPLFTSLPSFYQFLSLYFLILPSDEIMALLDEDDLPQEKLSDSFNTKWREIRGHQSPRKNKLSKEIMEQLTKNSCDASSEESSDWDPQDEQVNFMTRSFNSAIMDGTPNCLKRQRSSRGLVNIGNLLDCSEMDVSFCSTRSELPPCKSRSIRKKLRVRRMPRSMSDGEQLGIVSGPLTPQIRVSPPSTPLANSTRLLQQLDQHLEQISNDSSDTAPEQSDVQVYEWDEYHPPAKDESVAYLSTMSRSPEDLLSIDEDFGTHFGVHNTIRRLVEENKAHLQVVENSIEHGDIDAKQMSNVQMIVRANLRQLESVLRFQERQNFREGLDLEQLRGHWTGLLERVASPVPQILNKVERFASSLRDLHGMSSVSTLNGISEIRSKDDVRIALEALCEIEGKLSSERDELRSLLSSKVFRSELSELSAEFDTISQGYDDAVERIGGLVQSLKKLNLDWAEWNDQQTHIRMTMSTIEERLRLGEFDPQAVLSEMELCQERMNSLETMCNYLTSSLQSLQDDGLNKSIPDFRSEIILYFNALKQLKTRFNDLVRVPTPPMPSTIPFSQPEIVKRRVKTQILLTQIRPKKDVQQNQNLYKHVYVAVSTSWIIKSMLVLSLLSALAALFCAGILGSTFGPHLSYVNGPPPV